MFMNLFMKRHYILVKEEDVTKTLRVINEHCSNAITRQLVVDDCGWQTVDPNRWFIHFNCTTREWRAIQEEFETIGSLIIDEKRF